MISCPNKASQEWLDLVEKVGEDRAHILWNETKGDTKKVAEQIKSAFEEQTVFFKRRLSILDKRLKNLKPNDPKIAETTLEIEQLEAKLEYAVESQDRNDFKALGKEMLAKAEEFIVSLEQDRKSVSKDNLLFTINTLAAFEDFKGLKDDVAELFDRVYPFLSAHTIEVINDYKTEKFDITEEMIAEQTKDIGNLRKWVGALSDLPNYIGRTVGSLIKAAQNRASTTNKKLQDLVQKEVTKLEEWAKSNGKTLEQAYDMIITETNGDIRLIKKWKDGERDPKFDALYKPANKPLLDFYNFYLEVLKKSQQNLPYKVGKHHIPNIHKGDIKSKLKNLIKSEEVLLDEFRSSEDLYADMVPDMFRNRLPLDKKSRDLGSSILEFAAYANMHNELSNVLPEVRLLQQQLKYEKLPNGEVTKREFIKSTDSKTRIKAEDSNLYKMIDTVIDMQLKGKMSKTVFDPIKKGDIKDKDGNTIGYKQISPDKVLDLGLKYNSLLRIGLSPITAVSNVLFGDISNIIESVGGRFFGFKELNQATGIFFKQINYNSSKERKSELYEWLEKLNPLQELDDYNIADKVKLDKMSSEKLQEYMYSMQKKGELFLQSRTMIAILIKEGYMTSKGETTKEGKDLTEKQLQQLSDKIQRLNQMIHGRYSQREAATLQQSVIYRMAIQFRKWLPSALEARFGAAQYDNRLGVEIEGRYRTLARLIGTKEVLNNLIKMSKGELSELEMYNMKKNLIELTILAATILGYAWLNGGDDDEDKEKRKNPYVKTLLTLTNRISGDLMFLYSPNQINNLAKNAVPLAKTTGDLLKVVQYLPHALYYDKDLKQIIFFEEGSGSQYKKGNLKGSNKFYSQLSKVLIGFKPIQDVRKLVNENPLDEFQ